MPRAKRRAAEVDLDALYAEAPAPTQEAGPRKALVSELRELDRKILDLAQIRRESDYPATAPSLPECVFSRQWSVADEDQVQAEWATEKALWKIPSGSRPPYKCLWRLCLDVAGCTPWDIVGAATNLKFDHGDQQLPMWSVGFCKSLTDIVAHPVWSLCGAERAPHIATAIQYAAILRTDDRRPWDVSYFNDLRFIELEKAFAKALPFSVKTIRMHVTKACDKANMSCSPLWRVFDSLDKIVPEHTAAGGEGTISDDGLHLVKTTDLTHLAKALNGLSDPQTGIPVLLPVSLPYQIVLASRTSASRQPGTESELDWFHELALIEEKRRLLLKMRDDASGSDAGHDPVYPPRCAESLGDNRDGGSMLRPEREAPEGSGNSPTGARAVASPRLVPQSSALKTGQIGSDSDESLLEVQVRTRRRIRQETIQETDPESKSESKRLATPFSQAAPAIRLDQDCDHSMAQPLEEPTAISLPNWADEDVGMCVAGSDDPAGGETGIGSQPLELGRTDEANHDLSGLPSEQLHGELPFPANAVALQAQPVRNAKWEPCTTPPLAIGDARITQPLTAESLITPGGQTLDYCNEGNFGPEVVEQRFNEVRKDEAEASNASIGQLFHGI